MDQNCALLIYYAASSANFLPTFRDNLSVPSDYHTSPSLPLASTLLAATTLQTFQSPQSPLYKVRIGATGFLWDP